MQLIISLLKENRDEFMLPDEVADVVCRIVDLPSSLVMKDLTILPKNEWNA